VSGPLARLFWRVVDELDYWVTLARLRALDALCGPEAETDADRRERLEMELQGSHLPGRKGDSRPNL